MGAKLVRDNAVQYMHPELQPYIRPVGTNREHDELLVQKLLEEVGEFLASVGPDASIKEAADVLQVLFTIIRRRAGYMRDAELAQAIGAERETKLLTHGGFDVGTVWEV